MEVKKILRSYDEGTHIAESLMGATAEFGNVSLNACNVLADCLHGLVEFLRATACDEDVGTFVNKQLSCRESYPTAPSRDDRNLTFEFLGHRFSPLLLSCNEPKMCWA